MGKRTDNRAPNLHSNAEFQPHELWNRHAPLSHIAAYVPVTGVPNPRLLKTRDLEADTCMLDGSQTASLRWMM